VLWSTATVTESYFVRSLAPNCSQALRTNPKTPTSDSEVRQFLQLLRQAIGGSLCRFQLERFAIHFIRRLFTFHFGAGIGSVRIAGLRRWLRDHGFINWIEIKSGVTARNLHGGKKWRNARISAPKWPAWIWHFLHFSVKSLFDFT